MSADSKKTRQSVTERKSTEPARRGTPTKRTTVTLPEIIHDYAVQQCDARGFVSLSDYLTNLVREDKERAIRYSSMSSDAP